MPISKKGKEVSVPDTEGNKTLAEDCGVDAAKAVYDRSKDSLSEDQRRELAERLGLKPSDLTEDDDVS